MDRNSISINYFLVQKLGISHKEAIAKIAGKEVQINGIAARIHQVITAEDIIWVGNHLLKDAEKLLYIAYYKPIGIESTLHPEIPNSLFHALGLPDRVFPIGRLDKASEGLMLLTNDGRVCNKIADSSEGKEKEYIVKVDKPLTEEAIVALSKGVKILGKITRPAQVELLSSDTFSIILTEGMNRQIRRMCHKTGYEVRSLKRIRIHHIQLEDLQPGQWRNLREEEMQPLKAMLSQWRM